MQLKQRFAYVAICCVSLLIGVVLLIGCAEDIPGPLTEEERDSKEEQIELLMGKDGTLMMLVPEGEYLMGSSDGESNEKPVHAVYLDAFYIDKYEVTNALYKKFMDATGHKAPKYWSNSRYNAPDQPVVAVSWHDAKAYANWAEERLPTEAEWEKSARGGLEGESYPWGDGISHNDANYIGIGRQEGRWDQAAPVGSFDPNGYGLYDMAGNVWEWCADWYDGSYYAKSPKENPNGPSSGMYRIFRGGSWHGNPYNLRVAFRNYDASTFMYYGLGFRCAKSITP